MTPPWQESLQKIRDEGEVLQPPATDQELALLRANARSKLNAAVPVEYERFLREANGIGFNGFGVYASQTTPWVDIKGNILGFVEVTLMKWEADVNKPFLYFGSTGDEWFVFDQRSGKFAEIDQPSNDVLKEFNTFDDLLSYVLDKALTI